MNCHALIYKIHFNPSNDAAEAASAMETLHVHCITGPLFDMVGLAFISQHMYVISGRK